MLRILGTNIFFGEIFCQNENLFLGCDLYKEVFCKNGEESEGFELGLPNLKGLFV